MPRREAAHALRVRERLAPGLKPERRPADNTPQDPFERIREVCMSAPAPMSSSAAVILRRAALLLGWLSLLATLALLSPGIVATASASDPVDEAGPSCPISRDGDEHTAAELSQMIERLRSEVADRKGDGGGAVSLNTRGYNYPTGIPREPERDER
jgi:hypothetical protein